MRDLATRFRDQAESCRAYGSPLTAALLIGAADDIEAGGLAADLMAPHAKDPGGSVPSLRFAGSLHRLVLQGRAPGLAAHYPSVGGTADVEHVWPAAEAVVRGHLEELRELVTRTVQTNEVGRCAALYGGLLLLGGQVRLLEVGASGGLNLSCDRYAYEVGDQVLGDADSELRLVQPWQGDVPAHRGVEVVERLGCDPNPLDATTTEGRLTLASFVWGDHVERHRRLAAACEVVSRAPVTVERAHGLEFLDRELLPRSGVTTVVWHSVVWQYVDPVERAAMDALIEARGATATEDAPIAALAMEPAKVGGGEYEFQLHLTRWPGGKRRKVANVHGHGPPVVWDRRG
ncbi:MAG: DUF2332 domain-containing protein [Actinomycetota bacterium]|nr:DUF2332 domain-containing protein [Actinomycetota bacterium]